MLRFYFILFTLMATQPNTSPAHTAGPWYVDLFGTGVFADKPDLSCCVKVAEASTEDSGAMQVGEYDANLHLIAAAPELLERCEMLLDDVEQMAEDFENGRLWDWKLTEKNLRNLIAKAKNTPKP